MKKISIIVDKIISDLEEKYRIDQEKTEPFDCNLQTENTNHMIGEFHD